MASILWAVLWQSCVDAAAVTGRMGGGALVWFRSDLRIAYNPALWNAIRHVQATAGGPVVGLYVASAYEALAVNHWGAAKADYVQRTVACLGEALARCGVELVVKRLAPSGGAEEHNVRLAGAIGEACKERGCGVLFFNREYEAFNVARDAAVTRILEGAPHGIGHRSSEEQCVAAPGTLMTAGGGQPIRQFGNFKRRWLAALAGNLDGAGAPDGCQAYGETVRVLAALAADSGAAERVFCKALLDVEPYFVRGAADLPPVDFESVRKAFPAGEEAARARLEAFLGAGAASYGEARNSWAGCGGGDDGGDGREGRDGGSSRLSAPLAVGAISARECAEAAMRALGVHGGESGRRASIECWLGEVCWRDLYRHIMVHYGHVCEGRSFKPEMEAFPWRAWPAAAEGSDEIADGAEMRVKNAEGNAGGAEEKAAGAEGKARKRAKEGTAEGDADEVAFRRWRAGQTGVPIVDAAMRQLSVEAWLPNRARMIVASYLTKDLLVHWRRGERHFQERLVDADFASNNGGWQWCASTGTDSQPYFRIFNPHLQGMRFDPTGAYVRRYVRELAGVAGAAMHEAPPRRRALPPAYAAELVEHDGARRRTLALFKSFLATAAAGGGEPSATGKRKAEDCE